MTKLWIVLERGFEYNDETYDYQEGGNVRVALPTRQQAVTRQRELTKATLTSGDVGEFLGYDWRDYVSNIPELAHVENAWELDAAVKALDDAALDGLAGKLGEFFYFVEEVPLEA